MRPGFEEPSSALEACAVMLRRLDYSGIREEPSRPGSHISVSAAASLGAKATGLTESPPNQQDNSAYGKNTDMQRGWQERNN